LSHRISKNTLIKEIKLRQ